MNRSPMKAAALTLANLPDYSQVYLEPRPLLADLRGEPKTLANLWNAKGASGFRLQREVQLGIEPAVRAALGVLDSHPSAGHLGRRLDVASCGVQPRA